MTDYDKRVNESNDDREFNHKELMSRQGEKVARIYGTAIMPFNTYELPVKDDNNEK